MASISINKQGLVRVLFTAADGKRKTIYLGKTPKKTAESIRIRIEHLANAAASQSPVDPGRPAGWPPSATTCMPSWPKSV